jgi:hypothetical protein
LLRADEPAKRGISHATLVIYDSNFGNTEKVAEAIARGIVRSQRCESRALLRTLETAPRPDLMLVVGAVPCVAPLPFLPLTRLVLKVPTTGHEQC